MVKTIDSVFLIWLMGFVVLTAICFGTGGEHHIRSGEWKWIWFNLAIWPFWIGIIIFKLVSKKLASPK